MNSIEILIILLNKCFIKRVYPYKAPWKSLFRLLCTWLWISMIKIYLQNW